MRKILIVSDDPLLRSLVRSCLHTLPVETGDTATMAEAERICRRTRFDLLLVLRTAPFRCGGDPIRNLRRPDRSRPAVFVVAWPQEEQTVMGLFESGIDQYITFPVNPQRLRTKIAGALHLAT